MTTPLAMVDVSSNNHHAGPATFDWKAAKAAGYGAVMIKATEGANYVNPFLEEDAQGAHEAGLLVGYYHFAIVGEATPAAQCNNLWQHVKDLPRSLGLALDLEPLGVPADTNDSAVYNFEGAFVARFPREVEQRVLYSDPSFLQQYKITPKGDLWLASWGRRPRAQVWAWQSGAAVVPGLSDGNATDVGVFYG